MRRKKRAFEYREQQFLYKKNINLLVDKLFKDENYDSQIPSDDDITNEYSNIFCHESPPDCEPVTDFKTQSTCFYSPFSSGEIQNAINFSKSESVG